ncbi:MAG: sigma-54 factor interaction domain-containing protein, partial [Gammaproteobacteria bacterium]|nr:sigma-54 factor interaction domain-containing protein [Gammaproteobacteria bacterium]
IKALASRQGTQILVLPIKKLAERASAVVAMARPAPSGQCTGQFERANGGALFLDEIGELPSRDPKRYRLFVVRG